MIENFSLKIKEKLIMVDKSVKYSQLKISSLHSWGVQLMSKKIKFQKY